MSQYTPIDFEVEHLLPCDDTIVKPMSLRDDVEDPIRAYYSQECFEQNKTPKKMAQAISGLCCVCGATETPQWRSGPRGLNTLCNGCGIRWRKVWPCIPTQNRSLTAACDPPAPPDLNLANPFWTQQDTAVCSTPGGRRPVVLSSHAHALRVSVQLMRRLVVGLALYLAHCFRFGRRGAW
jgi:hypothetical protein